MRWYYGSPHQDYTRVGQDQQPTSKPQPPCAPTLQYDDISWILGLILLWIFGVPAVLCIMHVDPSGSVIVILLSVWASVSVLSFLAWVWVCAGTLPKPSSGDGGREADYIIYDSAGHVRGYIDKFVTWRRTNRWRPFSAVCSPE